MRLVEHGEMKNAQKIMGNKIQKEKRNRNIAFIFEK
jgi:hypothetical protein